jgi:hypothetical protein
MSNTAICILTRQRGKAKTKAIRNEIFWQDGIKNLTGLKRNSTTGWPCKENGQNKNTEITTGKI